MSLLCLGQFVFSLRTALPESLKRTSEWRHPSNSRSGARPARQYVGPGDDTVTLQGIIAPPVTGTHASLEQLRTMANTGLAWVLVDGDGYVYGTYAIEHLDEDKTHLLATGTPRRVAFTLRLARTDDNLTDPAGASAANGINQSAAAGTGTTTLA